MKYGNRKKPRQQQSGKGYALRTLDIGACGCCTPAR